MPQRPLSNGFLFAVTCFVHTATVSGPFQGRTMSSNVLVADYWKSAETDAGDAFADAAVVCLLLLAVPVKNSAYLVPPVFIALQLLSGNASFVGRTLLWGCVAVCVSTVSIMIDSLAARTVNPPGLLFGILTYATLAVMLGLRSDFTLSPTRWRSLRDIV